MSSLKKFIFTILLIMLGVVLWYLFVPIVQNLKKDSLSQQIDIEIGSNDPKPVTVGIGTTTIAVELVDSDSERNRGLGGRDFLGDDEGMLFVFEKPDYYGFWMKDMMFPIDIIWLDNDFNVVDITENVEVSSYPSSFTPRTPARYVLEVNAGFSNSHGVTVGKGLKLVDNNLSI